MIFANPKGRKVVEDLWPDVQWTTDEKFAKVHTPDWLFTHIRVTKLPPHLEATVPLTFASPDSLGMAVAMTIQRHAEPERVLHWSGEGPDVKVNIYRGLPKESGTDLFAEYIPPGLFGEPKSVN
jgi:hypothetical protein